MVFNNLTHEIFSYLISSTKAKDSGKSISIDRRSGQEIVMFFKLDGGYINDEKPKADFLCYYYDIKSHRKMILIIELKGGDTPHAIEQLETVINHSKMQPILGRFDGMKKAIILYTGSAPKNLKKKKHEFFKKWKIILEAKHSKKANLREFL